VSVTREERVVPRAEPRSYYGQPVLKAPVWTWEVPTYFFLGGLAGSSAGLAWLAGLRGNEELARRSWALALAGLAASPPLLISDLGRPSRFFNMLRMFKVTSPMSVGSWLLSAGGAATAVAAANALGGRLDGAARVARPAAAGLGLPISTYTAALVADTAVPVWHEARMMLPFVFGAGAAASAGAAATVVTRPEHAAPARRLAVGGAAAELLSTRLMENRLGELGAPYRGGTAGSLSRAATALTLTGAALVAGLGRRRSAAAAGGALVLAGALAERWSIYKAGFKSASDPTFTVGPQRERLRASGG
jgi:polysulfide reductase-like protein